jgi:hypothetical protein
MSKEKKQNQRSPAITQSIERLKARSSSTSSLLTTRKSLTTDLGGSISRSSSNASTSSFKPSALNSPPLARSNTNRSADDKSFTPPNPKSSNNCTEEPSNIQIWTLLNKLNKNVENLQKEITEIKQEKISFSSPTRIINNANDRDDISIISASSASKYSCISNNSSASVNSNSWTHPNEYGNGPNPELKVFLDTRIGPVAITPDVIYYYF